MGGVFRQIAPDHRTHANYATGAYRNAMLDQGATPNETAGSDMNTTIDDNSSRYVAVVVHIGAVLN
jgi:hypothetical protein